MTPYRQILEKQPHNAINKWSHYPEIYDEIFAPYREKCRSVLEIGVQNGGSLQALAQIFPNAAILGLDVNPACAALDGKLGDRVRVMIGDATNIKRLQCLPNFDVIIDDGSHIPQMQAVSFSYLFQTKLATDGVYIVEDLEHSYQDWWRKEPWFAVSNFFDFLRSKIDEMHLAYTDPKRAAQSPTAMCIRKIVTYHGMAVIYKSEPRPMPENTWWDGPKIISP